MCCFVKAVRGACYCLKTISSLWTTRLVSAICLEKRCKIMATWLTSRPPPARRANFWKKHPYRLVVVDWRLPDGDGTIVANLAAVTGAYAFVMSGYLPHMPPGSVDPRQTLMKPIRPPELLVIVRGCIGEPSAASDTTFTLD